LGLPVRGLTPGLRYCGDFYGQDEAGRSRLEALTEKALIAILRRLEPGTTELACHPAAWSDLDTMYATERLLETETLCSVAVRRTIAELGIELCPSWRVPRLLRAAGVVDAAR
jgi:hypothetical protein